MSQPIADDMSAILRELGLPIRAAGAERGSGFPVLVPLRDGGDVIIEVPEPLLLENFDPKEVGVAIVDPLGFVDRTWGLASSCHLLKRGKCVFEGELKVLAESSRSGVPGSLYVDGYRFHAAPLGGKVQGSSMLLVLNAFDEVSARKLARKGDRQTEILKRIGKVFTMTKALKPLCFSAVHEIAGILDLAAVLLWVKGTEGGEFRLAASVGINRSGTATLQTISVKSIPSCLAELVAFTKRHANFESVLDCDYTIGLEANCCYLSPGGVTALNLVSGDDTVGVLELISRSKDHVLTEESNTIETIAEHLAAAISNATQFESIERLATYDPLTGIANHRSMQEFLLRRIAEAKRTLGTIGVLMIDVDHFRAFNEEEGHDAGDKVLKSVVSVLSESVRPYDLAARYGGEEFTVVMPGATRPVIMAIAERIRSKVEAMGYVTPSGRPRSVTVSIGAAMYPDTSETPGGVLKGADLALFDAKRAGRNRIVWFEGKLVKEAKVEGVDQHAVHAWIGDEGRESALKLRSRLEPYLDHLCLELALTTSQCHMLDALIEIAPTYIRARENNELLLLRSLESAPELRSLIPSLEAIFERWDGGGQKGIAGTRIPLLGRILLSLLVISGEIRSDGMTKVGLLDPEIVAILSEVEKAA